MKDLPQRAPSAALGGSAKWSCVSMGRAFSSLVPEADMAIVCVGVDFTKNARADPVLTSHVS